MPDDTDKFLLNEEDEYDRFDRFDDSDLDLIRRRKRSHTEKYTSNHCSASSLMQIFPNTLPCRWTHKHTHQYIPQYPRFQSNLITFILISKILGSSNHITIHTHIVGIISYSISRPLQAQTIKSSGTVLFDLTYNSSYNKHKLCKYPV
jgi:hypothetical protein